MRFVLKHISKFLEILKMTQEVSGRCLRGSDTSVRHKIKVPVQHSPYISCYRLIDYSVEVLFAFVDFYCDLKLELLVEYSVFQKGLLESISCLVD